MGRKYSHALISFSVLHKTPGTHGLQEEVVGAAHSFQVSVNGLLQGRNILVEGARLSKRRGQRALWRRRLGPDIDPR